MSRGKASQIGDTRWSPNGYHYTRIAKGWELTHRILAEEKLGRELKDNERVRFVDGNRKNLDPVNIEVFEAKKSGKARRIAVLKARIEELQAELADLEQEEASA